MLPKMRECKVSYIPRSSSHLSNWFLNFFFSFLTGDLESNFVCASGCVECRGSANGCVQCTGRKLLYKVWKDNRNIGYCMSSCPNGTNTFRTTAGMPSECKGWFLFWSLLIHSWVLLNTWCKKKTDSSFNYFILRLKNAQGLSGMKAYHFKSKFITKNYIAYINYFPLQMRWLSDLLLLKLCEIALLFIYQN